MDPDGIVGSKSKILVRDRKVDKQEAACATIADKQSAFDFCFDPQSGALIRSGGKYSAFTTYSNFTSFQGRLFPGTIEIMNGKNSILLFRRESIAPLGNPDPTLFNPPENAEAWPTCDAPIVPNLVHQMLPDFRHPGLSGKVVVYVVVGMDGLIHNPKVLRATFQQDAALTLNALKSWKSSPRTCHGVPQPTEGITTFSYENQ